ncbi:MAG: ABC transporter substrate-binding protein [Coriobacteriaceae bacterium]|nr:ABC transporter substrate-binding protein [Coriobacteriaceae bacterium]
MTTLWKTARMWLAGMCMAAVMACALSGCSGQQAPSDAATDAAGDTSQVVVALSTEAEPAAGFNPIINWGSGEHMHEPLLQSTLITTDADLNFHNDLATDYGVSDDGMTWTFHIRDDVKFTDGEPLTAADVAFTINKIIESPNAETDLSMVHGAEATDATTVVITMARPYNALLYELAVVGIVPEHAYTDAYGTTPEATIGSGRYMLEQWDQGQQAIFTANPDYYGEAPKIKRVVVLFMEEDAALAAAASGDVDLAFTSATLANSTPAGYSILACKSVDSRGLALPVQTSGAEVNADDAVYPAGNDVTCHKEIRQAINMGVDRQRFIDNVLNGYGTVAYSVGTGMPWYSDDMEVAYDPEAAQKLLEDAGWAKGEDGIYAKDGTLASIDVIYSTTDSVREGIAREFANQMAEIGIQVNLKGMSMSEAMAYAYSTPVVWGFGSNAPFEIESLYSLGGSFNVALYDNGKVNEYIADALAAPTLEESFDLWKKAQWDGETGFAPKGDAPWVWIANVDHLFFQKDGLQVAEQKPQPHGHGWSVLNNVDQWSWSE